MVQAKPMATLPLGARGGGAVPTLPSRGGDSLGMDPGRRAVVRAACRGAPGAGAWRGDPYACNTVLARGPAHRAIYLAMAGPVLLTSTVTVGTQPG